MVTGRKSEGQRAIDKTRDGGRVALTALIAVTALVLTCRKWDNRLDAIGNHPPTAPTNPSPADSGIGQDSGLVLSWHSHDLDDGDSVYFTILFDTVAPPETVAAGWTDTTFGLPKLDSPKRYYWQVIASDNHDTSAAGPIWQFQTVVPLAVTAPDTGERLTLYTTDTITWTGGPSGAVDSIIIQRSTDDGAAWSRLGQATTPGQCVWQVPAPATEYARVRVQVYLSTTAMTGTSGRFAIEDTLPLVLKGADSGPVAPRH